MISIEENIDEIFGGGLIENTVTQIYGPPASGKTNLCLIIAVNIAIKDKKVLFI
ncbi:MAG: ATPase domain-containing protein, partial [Candidatus Altarchaeaceae archaeon]